MHLISPENALIGVMNETCAMLTHRNVILGYRYLKCHGLMQRLLNDTVIDAGFRTEVTDKVCSPLCTP